MVPLSRRQFLQLGAAAGTAKWASLGSGGLLGATPDAVPAEPYGVRFTDIAKDAGLTDTVYYGSSEQVRYIVEANGCGVAFYDYDNDGWPDIFVLNGTRLDGLPLGAKPTNRLYKNNRDGTFTDVTEDAGLVRSGWANSVCIGDFDNDGNDVLFVTYWRQNVLYRNNGDGTFSDVTEEAGLGGFPDRWNAGATFIDYDRDGHLDLFVSNYVDIDLERVPLPGQGNNCEWKGVPVFCGPRGMPGTKNYLYRNNGDGTFTDVSEQAGMHNPHGYYGMTALVTDVNEDGWPDIYVACDSTPSILYRNNRNGTFTDIAVECGVAYSEDGREQAGMGLATGDYDGDGKLDIVKTLFADEMPALYRNFGNGTFADMSVAAGLHVVTQHIQWGTGLVDFDNDSWPDLFYSVGNLFPTVERFNPRYPYRGPRFLFRNMRDGSFANVTNECGSGLTTPHSSRGCAFGDFDNDGDMDILVMNMNEPPSLIRADVSTGNHWLKVKLFGVESNRTAIGARVDVQAGGRTQAQEVHSQTSYYSVNDFRLHFGLGSNSKADELSVRWPNGKRETFRDLPADRLLHIEEGSGIVRSEKL
ncbi:MAG: CRTAC1 family protein [Acidobacteriia bacterium]|nr:CRTAC1 family protein [Terriglobia bacterium]